MNGMDEEEDETDLFDDDFDNLSESALQELEQNALLSTQQAQLQARNATKPFQPAVQRPTSLPHNHFHAQVRGQFNPGPQIIKPSIQRHAFEPQPYDDTFELVGEEGVPTPVEEYDSYPLRRAQLGETAQREQWRQQRYAGTYNDAGRVSAPGETAQNGNQRFQASQADGRFNGLLAQGDEMLLDGPLQNRTNMTQGDGFDGTTMEREQLARELQAAKDMVSMQKGEISIIRANAEKESKVFDRQISALKKTIEEESVKHAAAIDALVEKNNKLTTSYHFLQQDHHQELRETKTLKQLLKDKQQDGKGLGGDTTPKRGVASSLRDGFEDDDIMVVSPSKSARRSKPTTPTAANKRKRKADAPSPVKPLVLRPSAPNTSEMPPPRPQPAQQDDLIVPIVRKDKQAERNLRFLQSILDYRVKGTNEPLFEALARFSFPTNASKTLSAILLEATAHLKGDRLRSDLLQIFIDLWSKSMKEQYYKPVALLVEILGHMIDWDMSAVDAAIVTNLTPVLQTAITVNAEKRFKHSPVNHSTYGTFRQTPQEVLHHEVDGTSCLELLLTVAYVVSDDMELISLFWGLLDPEFILMMLSPWQPISDIRLMLRMLATSIFAGTFGKICREPQQQQKIEHWCLNRICSLLWETPKVDEGLPPYTTEQLCRLRLEVMELLTKMAITSSPYPHDDPTHHGSRLVARDVHAIGRIVRSLHDEVSAMYDLTPSHPLHAEFVNRGVRLLHHLLRLHEAEINLQEKLAVIPGGVHKHRVVLTRLAFSEGFFVDRLITDDTVAMATTMLEESVTPDEADELIEAFPGFKGRGGSNTVGDDDDDEDGQ